MLSIFARGRDALRRDGVACFTKRMLKRARTRSTRFFDDKVLGLANHVSPHFYTSLYRRVHGHDRQIKRLVLANSEIIRSKALNAKRKLFIDCGVNEGVVLSRYRKALPDFDFVGFEIQNDVLEYAGRVNPGVELRNEAVGAKTGHVTVFLVGKSRVNLRGGSSTLQPAGRTKQEPDYTVPVIRFLDYLMNKRESGYDFITVKMDIEGAEYAIIDDIYNAFAKTGVPLIDYLMIEFHPSVLDEGVENERYTEVLDKMGVDYTTWI